MKRLVYDAVVVGSGIAGLTVARQLSKQSKTCLITKSALKEGSTLYAQGGIAAVMDKSDAYQYHYNDTIKAGAGLCDAQAVDVLVKEGPDRVRELIELGANFDKSGHGYDLTKEGAHCRRRILHAGDATGREIEKTLGNALLHDERVDFLVNTSILRLLVKDGQCYGCVALEGDDPFLIMAKVVVIATGGCGQVYSHTTNPPVATGDGLSIAFQAGAAVQDMEFVQFHPTTLYLGDKRPISIFLISEAVRGEGGVLRNSNGDRFMSRYHPDGELAPRDIVSRAIVQECSRQNVSHVYLDLSPLTVNVKDRFPMIYGRCLESGLDITRDWIPVSPAMHYVMGGVKTDVWGRTTLRGLYAVGEVASLGLHGANRLASNSLLDGLVFGYRVAEDACRFLKEGSMVVADNAAQVINEVAMSSSQLAGLLSEKERIRRLMWSNVGIIRTADSLNEAWHALTKLRWILKLSPFSVPVFEVQNMIIVSALMTYFSRQRCESRGGHYRSDYPNTHDQLWQKRQVMTRSQVKSKREPLTASH